MRSKVLFVVGCVACGGSAGTAPVGVSPVSPVSPAEVAALPLGGVTSALPPLSAKQCDEGAGAPNAGPDCVTADIHCGETVRGHTLGGVKRYDTRFYEANYCWPAIRNHDGGDERIYRFVFDDSPMSVRDRSAAKITFSTPCADLDITSMVSHDANRCPTGSRICDTVNPTRKGNERVRSQVITMDKGEVWYFLVEGADDAEGAFSLTLECDREH